MFLYKLEIELTDRKAAIIVLSESDEKAFAYAESHLTRHFIKTPDIKEMVIVEKKRVEKGSGYVIDTEMT
jgi:hypothetical protein